MKVKSASKNTEQFLFLFLLACLLLLRVLYPVLKGFGVLKFPDSAGSLLSDDVPYILAALLILLKRNTLAQYNVGKIALILFVIAPLLNYGAQYFMYLKLYGGQITPSLNVSVVASLLLALGLLILNPKLPKRSIKNTLLWLAIAAAVGIAMGTASALYSKNLFSDLEGASYAAPTVMASLYTFISQLSGSAVISALLFRGFLWGYLEDKGWSWYWILLFQATLVTLGGIHYAFSGYAYTIISAFIAALIMGLLAWRSKCVAPGIAASAFQSVTLNIMLYLFIQ